LIWSGAPFSNELKGYNKALIKEVPEDDTDVSVSFGSSLAFDSFRVTASFSGAALPLTDDWLSLFEGDSSCPSTGYLSPLILA
jgi:hypothetical protein